MADQVKKSSFKKWLIIIGIVIILGGGGILYYKWFGSADAQNKWGRKMIEMKEGNYDVTFATQGFNKTWKVRGGKITSVPEKGYYFFWEGKEYRQSPIATTFIEEVK